VLFLPFYLLILTYFSAFIINIAFQLTKLLLSLEISHVFLLNKPKNTHFSKKVGKGGAKWGFFL